jgi:hypothetical protein
MLVARAPEFGNLATASVCISLTGMNCAVRAGVSPSITQGLQDVTLCPTCGPFGEDAYCWSDEFEVIALNGCPLAATT